MYDSFTAQLAGLDLTGFSVQPAPFNETDFPAEEASEQTLSAVWSDLFALFADTALEADAEDIAWGFVNLFHRAATRKSAQVDRASDEIRALLSAADGSEVHSSNLEEQVERAQATPVEVVALADEYRLSASLLLQNGRPREPRSRAPFRMVAIHAVELYLNAFLLHSGHAAGQVRGLQHNLAARADLACEFGLSLRKRTPAPGTYLARHGQSARCRCHWKAKWR